MLRTKLPFFLAYATARQQPIFIEYIETTEGQQWIDMETLLNQNHKVSVTARTLESNKVQILFGNILNVSSAFSCSCGNVVANSRFSNAYYSGGLFRTSERPVTYTVSKTGITVDGEVLNWNTTPRDFQLTESAFLIGNRAVGISYANNRPAAGTRIYDSKTYENDVLIQHLRPCIHPETFEVCMYDTVKHKYHYNQGTSPFIPAPRFVEYLEFDGASYIDTGLFPNSNWRIESVWLATVGSKNIYTSNVVGKRIFGRSGGTWWFGASAVASNNTKLPLNTVNTTVHDKNGVIFNGVSYAYDKEVDEFDTSVDSLYLGTLKTNLPTSFEGRIYDFKIYDNDVLIQHLRPCLRGNTPCMYDMVTGKYFYNQGTGEFIAGGEIA